jgi:signal peptidase II
MPWSHQRMKQTILHFLKSIYGQVFLGLFILDILTKQWAAISQVNIEIIPSFFFLSYSRNTGAAWSILAGNQVILAIISLGVGVGFGYYYLKNYNKFSFYNHLGISFFLSGTWGNFIDRAFFPEGVIDFLSFRFGSYIFPTFNVADSALTIGVIILFVTSLFEKRAS